jgi:hypothetical protein
MNHWPRQVYQALPSHREWTVSKIGVLFLANLGANIVWLLVFGRGNKSRVALWLAAVILFGGILATLIALHTSLGVHYGNAGVATWEKWGAHVFISLYMGELFVLFLPSLCGCCCRCGCLYCCRCCCCCCCCWFCCYRFYCCCCRC